jgi:ribosomal protein L12E/L44/L45/RPP1/RPP2
MQQVNRKQDTPDMQYLIYLQVTAVITAAGGEASEEAITKLFADLEGKDIHELLAKGEEQLKSCVSSGGGGGGAAPAGK